MYNRSSDCRLPLHLFANNMEVLLMLNVFILKTKQKKPNNKLNNKNIRTSRGKQGYNKTI